LLLAATLLIRLVLEKRLSISTIGFSLLSCLMVLVGIVVAGYAFYLPFYISYQQLYVNGLGMLKQGTMLSDFLLVFGFWIFLALSFFLLGFCRRWIAFWRRLEDEDEADRWSQWCVPASIVLGGTFLIVLVGFGVKGLLASLLLVGLY